MHLSLCERKAKIVDPKSFEEVPIVDLSMDEVRDVSDTSIKSLCEDMVLAKLKYACEASVSK